MWCSDIFFFNFNFIFYFCLGFICRNPERFTSSTDKVPRWVKLSLVFFFFVCFCLLDSVWCSIFTVIKVVIEIESLGGQQRQ